MNRVNVEELLRSISNCTIVQEATEYEDAGQHYIEILVATPIPQKVASEVEASLEGTDWEVWVYDERKGPIYYDRESDEEKYADLRVKKNTWNAHRRNA